MVDVTIKNILENKGSFIGGLLEHRFDVYMDSPLAHGNDILVTDIIDLVLHKVSGVDNSNILEIIGEDFSCTIKANNSTALKGDEWYILKDINGNEFRIKPVKPL